MTVENSEGRDGFLTEEDVSYLVNQCDEQTRELCQQRLRRLLPAVLEDLVVCWRFLPDEDLRAMFEDAPETQIRDVRSATEPIIALLYYAATLNGDDIEYRMSEGTKAAEAVRGNHAEVDYSVRTSPLLSPIDVVEQLEATDFSFEGISPVELDQLWWADDVSAERVARLFTPAGSDEEVDELAATISTLRASEEPFPRPPEMTLVDMETCRDYKQRSDDTTTSE